MSLQQALTQWQHVARVWAVRTARRWGLIVAAAALACLGGAAVPASGTIISDTQISFTYSPAIPVGPWVIAGYEALVHQNYPGNPTSVWFSFAGSALTFQTINLDEGSDWYLAEQGDVFSPSSIAGGEFTLVGGGNLGLPGPAISVPLGDFYLGVATTETPNPFTFSQVRNVFGWLKLHNDGTTLTALGNAVAYGEPGIRIGSTVPVPEPGSLLVGIAGAAGLLMRRRRLY